MTIIWGHMFFCQEQANVNLGYLGEPSPFKMQSDLKIFVQHFCQSFPLLQGKVLGTGLPRA